ncbi:MAG TPA: MarR family winged helix-turn-helix transcriptional regulator [Solirubrobacteraceae bacterium]|jgi:DNA-binding MarR family transcriptional regulator
MAIADHTQNTPSASSAHCLTTDLGWLLGRADHVFGSEVAAALAPLGLGSRGYCVLQAALTGEFTQTQLASMVGLDKTTMVVTVDKLEQLGLAERTPSATDRRARVIKVTEAGEEKVAEGQRIVDAVQEAVLDTLPVDERDAFVNALKRLVSDRLSTAPECHPPLRRREPRG